MKPPRSVENIPRSCGKRGRQSQKKDRTVLERGCIRVRKKGHQSYEEGPQELGEPPGAGRGITRVKKRDQQDHKEGPPELGRVEQQKVSPALGKIPTRITERD
jgi:hypothetical protein